MVAPAATAPPSRLARSPTIIASDGCTWRLSSAISNSRGAISNSRRFHLFHQARWRNGAAGRAGAAIGRCVAYSVVSGSRPCQRWSAASRYSSGKDRADSGLSYFEASSLFKAFAARWLVVGVALLGIVPRNDVNDVTSLLGTRLILNLLGALARAGRFDTRGSTESRISALVHY